MKRKSSLQKAFVLLIVFMLTVIPNLGVYSFVGDFSASSSAIEATSKYSIRAQPTEKLASWLAVAAEAIALAYAAGYVVGTIAHHAWNALGEEQALQQTVALLEPHNPTDFSKFDN
jgi:hypothetical protein